MKDTLLIELHFFPSVDYFSKVVSFENLLIESMEHYQKGSCRNRAYILTANGVSAMTVPLVKGKNRQMPIRDVKISYDDDWQRRLSKNLQSAYGRSPFYAHYEDSLQPFFSKHFTYLYDYNLEILNFFRELLKINTFTEETRVFSKTAGENTEDARNTLKPVFQKVPALQSMSFHKYHQVFEDRFGFIPGLSILDLLFCTGPEAHTYLHRQHELK